MDNHEFLHQWNQPLLYSKNCELVDETLRDGLQAPDIIIPSLKEKLLLIDQMEKNKVNRVIVSFPASSEVNFKESYDVIDYVDNKGYQLSLSFLSRVLKSDLMLLAKLQKYSKRQLFGFEFISCSSIRMYIEGWNLDHIKKSITESTRFLIDNGLIPILGFEDSSRSHPDDLREVITAGLDAGAQSIVLADTVGYIDPSGVEALIPFIRSITGQSINIEWHGHNDRGLALINALTALSCGVDAIHATSLGIGERTGNLCLEHFVINLYLSGQEQIDLSNLYNYAQLTSRFTKALIPPTMPALGSEVFTTGSGIHASAIHKAIAHHNLELADLVYSSVPAGKLNRKQKLEISPMSGRSNVIYKCKELGITCTDEQIIQLLDIAKQENRFLTSEEIILALK